MVDTCTQGVDTGFAALGYAKVAALGVVQGITELLPISSTAHMRLVPAFLGWQDPGSAFSAAMQLAARHCCERMYRQCYARHRRKIGEANFTDAIMVGLAQTGALIPGVSRSGSTLTAALALGFRRDEAARLSFLLGLPAIALAGFKELWELYKIHLDPQAWSVLAVGLAVASVSAFFAIWGLMRVLERFSSWPFVIYRFALGIIILAGTMVGWLS
jgi:undecaprenyl pyrophosphate phosphatase UppP